LGELISHLIPLYPGVGQKRHNLFIAITYCLLPTIYRPVLQLQIYENWLREDKGIAILVELKTFNSTQI